MALLLNIETTTRNCSVSLAENGITKVYKEIAEENFSHAEKLHVFIQDLLKDGDYTLKQLNAIAVSEGPGSYTGLRIGVSSAKGLCYALNIPLIAVDTMQILAAQITVNEGCVIPMIDARRMEVYLALFNEKGEKKSETKAEIIDENSFKDLNTTIHLLGDGALKFKEILTDTKFIYYPSNLFPSAKEMSALSFQKYSKENFVDVAYFEPYYLKDFVLNR